MRVYILVSYSLHANPFLEEKLRFHWQEVIVFILLRCILLSYISQLSTIAIAWKRVVNYTHAFINLDPNVSIAFLTIYTIICLRCLSQQLYYSKRMSFAQVQYMPHLSALNTCPLILLFCYCQPFPAQCTDPVHSSPVPVRKVCNENVVKLVSLGI